MGQKWPIAGVLGMGIYPGVLVLKTDKAKNLAYCRHTMRKQESCLEKKIMQGTMPGSRRRGRPRTAWLDNIKTWTGLTAEVSIRMAEWHKYIEKVRSRCGQSANQWWLMNRTKHIPNDLNNCIIWLRMITAILVGNTFMLSKINIFKYANFSLQSVDQEMNCHRELADVLTCLTNLW